MNTTKSVQEMKKKYFFFERKEEVRVVKLYQKDCNKKLKVGKIDKDKMNRRKHMAQIEKYISFVMEYAHENLTYKEERWKDLIKLVKKKEKRNCWVIIILNSKMKCKNIKRNEIK